MPSIARRSRDDSGFTLVELMVAALLTVVVLSVVGGIMFSSTKTENSVRTVSQATSAGQLVTNSIESGIRNSAVSVNTTIPFQLTTPSGSDQMVVALVVGNAAVASGRCVAWYYSASQKTISYTSSSSAIAAPTASALASWTRLSGGVTPLSGSTTIFSLRGTQGLTLAFREDVGSNNSAIVFQSSISSRTGLTGSFACY